MQLNLFLVPQDGAEKKKKNAKGVEHDIHFHAAE